LNPGVLDPDAAAGHLDIVDALQASRFGAGLGARSMQQGQKSGRAIPSGQFFEIGLIGDGRLVEFTHPIGESANGYHGQVDIHVTGDFQAFGGNSRRAIAKTQACEGDKAGAPDE